MCRKRKRRAVLRYRLPVGENINLRKSYSSCFHAPWRCRGVPAIHQSGGKPKRSPSRQERRRESEGETELLSVKPRDLQTVMAPKRVGIVGYGHLGKFLTKAVQERPDLELAFVWNRRPRCYTVKWRAGRLPAYTTYKPPTYTTYKLPTYTTIQASNIYNHTSFYHIQPPKSLNSTTMQASNIYNHTS
nr:uncharacterized protein LOC113806573 [Penaeus vannamei]